MSLVQAKFVGDRVQDKTTFLDFTGIPLPKNGQNFYVFSKLKYVQHLF